MYGEYLNFSHGLRIFNIVNFCLKESLKSNSIEQEKGGGEKEGGKSLSLALTMETKS